MKAGRLIEMSNYVPRADANKKKNILAQREEELRHHLLHGAVGELIERYAERLRAAQLALIKALLHEMKPVAAGELLPEEFRANLLKRRELWRSIPVGEIVAVYRSQLLREEQQSAI